MNVFKLHLNIVGLRNLEGPTGIFFYQGMLKIGKKGVAVEFKPEGQILKLIAHVLLPGPPL